MAVLDDYRGRLRLSSRDAPSVRVLLVELLLELSSRFFSLSLVCTGCDDAGAAVVVVGGVLLGVVVPPTGVCGWE